MLLINKTVAYILKGHCMLYVVECLTCNREIKDSVKRFEHAHWLAYELRNYHDKKYQLV